MELLKDWTLKWWQTSLIKVSMASLGIILGIYFADVLSGYMLLWWILFLVPGAYLGYVYFKQN